VRCATLLASPGAMWPRSSVHRSVVENAQPRAGPETVLAKLSELLGVKMIRRSGQEAAPAPAVQQE
jgi:hypothetical protein